MESVDSVEKICYHSFNKTFENNLNNNDNNETAIEKCEKWMEDCSLSDTSESSDGSIYEENFISETCSEITEGDGVVVLKSDNVRLNDEITVTDNNNTILELENIIDQKPNKFENINIYKANNVHIGNVTNIHGPVYINQLKATTKQNIVINKNKTTQPDKFFIVPRRTWLAQPPLDPDDVQYLSGPAKFVIISHSASEEAYTQCDNNLIVRLIQQFHIESKKWNDISYNFLFGAEGSVYEGRGWKVVGAHTFGYNRISLGLCFIGCYMKKLPPLAILKKAQDFIKYGVEIGAIAPDYKLLGHCQCSSTESPGRRLFEEIQTWDNWDGSVSHTNPSPLKHH